MSAHEYPPCTGECCHRYPGQGSPWADFLNARARVLEEWRQEGKTAEQSARAMSMDPGQVRLILAHVADNPDEFPTAPRTPKERP